MAGVGSRFDWDLVKASRNRRHHGISFEEAATAFADPLSQTVPDPSHSEREDRFVLIGTTRRGVLVVVVHTEQANTVRLISARRANRRERHDHEIRP